MTAFQPGDVVRHQSGVTGTLVDWSYPDDWWVTDEDDICRHWCEKLITLVERPYPGAMPHPLTDVDIPERPWLRPVMYLLAAVALVLVAAFGIVALERL